MFCTSLRRRPSISPVIPLLISEAGLKLREASLKTHDLSITLRSNASCLRVLILTPSSVQPATLQATIERIQHFHALTGGQNLLILFLLKPAVVNADPLSRTGDIGAYTALTTALLENDDEALNIVPVVLLHSLGLLKEALERFVRSQETSRAQREKALKSNNRATYAVHSREVDLAMDVLPLCTTTPPMSRQTSFVLSDIFRNLSEVAKAAIDAGRELDEAAGASGVATKEDMPTWTMLVAAIGEQEAKDVVDFWREEWVAE